MWLRIGGFEYELVVSSCMLGVTGRQAKPCMDGDNGSCLVELSVVIGELDEHLHGCSCFLVDR